MIARPDPADDPDDPADVTPRMCRCGRRGGRGRVPRGRSSRSDLSRRERPWPRCPIRGIDPATSMAAFLGADFPPQNADGTSGLCWRRQPGRVLTTNENPGDNMRSAVPECRPAALGPGRETRRSPARWLPASLIAVAALVGAPKFDTSEVFFGVQLA